MKRLRKLLISSIIYPCAKQNGNRPSGGTMDIIQKIKEELQVEKWQVEAAVKLIDEGNTIPFISRYRKEITGSLNDEQLRNLDERLTYLRSLEDKKEQVLKSIEEQGKLTDELKEKILAAQTLVVVEVPTLSTQEKDPCQYCKGEGAGTSGRIHSAPGGNRTGA